MAREASGAISIIKRYEVPKSSISYRPLLAAQGLLQSLKNRPEVEHVDVADDHQVNVAVRPIGAARNGSAGECGLDLLSKRPPLFPPPLSEISSFAPYSRSG
ncbi:hypothetical protein FHT72_006383 [Rhizobium sp. BK077]|nr:hypothetical protein [Rhizobium sp. BK112]MBB3371851.1 hypothetical protein [Rhizobium sp. BK077]MBB4182818.1 hypothetical protein [Rhizobium sp. BK109]